MNDRSILPYPEDLLAARRPEGGEPARARPQNPGSRTGRRPCAVQGRRHRQAHVLSGGGQVELRADDRVMGVRKPAPPEARAALAPGLPRKFTRACRQGSRIHHDRQRSARRAVDLGSDRPVRGRGIARRRPRRDRRLDDHAAADQGLPSHPARQHSGDLHAHAAHQLSRPRCGDQTRDRRATSSMWWSRANAS